MPSLTFCGKKTKKNNKKNKRSKCSLQLVIYTLKLKVVTNYEGKSISNQPIPFPIDRDTQDFHALFQYMF